MANLLLGPLLRHVQETEATLWVETDAPCEVEVLGARSRTFHVEGHHYALVRVPDLEPDRSYEYEVRLNGRRVWPEPGSTLPPSSIRTLASGRDLRLVFGSCRVSLPHEPPYVLSGREDARGQGIDALRTLALRMTRSKPDTWPDCLLMLGDQVYADDLSPAMLAMTRARGTSEAAEGQLDDFDEYTAAYREAWGELVIRWLLSTVPTAMIFDDHEIHAQWKTSQAWLEERRVRPGYDQHITAGLMAYWVYQHLGNLSPAELEENELFAGVRRERDAGPFLREHMRRADRQSGHSRWSFSRDFGRVRLVVIDSRAGRELAPGRRKMVSDEEWVWITERATGEFDHLLLASSVPFLLPHGLHHVETWDEALTDGAWGKALARFGELARQRAVMDHWASFRRSFDRVAELLEELATGRRGGPPASIVMLSGDVHHCYLADVGFPRGTGARSAVWQAVCSAYRKELSRRERLAMRLGASRAAHLVARMLARAAGVGHPRIAWRLTRRPGYENQVATLTLSSRRAHLRLETPAGSEWRDPDLTTVFEHRLLG